MLVIKDIVGSFLRNRFAFVHDLMRGIATCDLRSTNFSFFLGKYTGVFFASAAKFQADIFIIFPCSQVCPFYYFRFGISIRKNVFKNLLLNLKIFVVLPLPFFMSFKSSREVIHLVLHNFEKKVKK